nr:SseB family protein [Planosporangium flavigriseum]
MRAALRAGDQEHYFRLLARLELVLPMDPDTFSDRAPVAWGTWATDSRTHVLAFTSPAALDACLAEHAGTFRKLPFHELAATWPDPDWWLAVNPGLPIEGYLPPWFVTQISRGDVRLPGRTMGAQARIEQATALRSRTPDPAALPSGPAANGQPGRNVGLPPAGGGLLPREGRALSRRVELLSRHGFGDPRREAAARPDSRAVGAGAPADAVPEHIGATENVIAQTEGDRTSHGYEPARDFGAPFGTPNGAPIGMTEVATQPEVPTRTEAVTQQEETPADPVAATSDFTPANQVEESLLEAAEEGSTDSFLSTLLLAKVLVPGAQDAAVANIDQWHTEDIDSQRYVVVFTSTERLTHHLGADSRGTWIKFTQLINAWPRESLSFAVNPGTPIGATLPGAQIVALATWAAGEGLTGEQPELPEPAATPDAPLRSSLPPPATGPVVMQKTIAASQVPYYLERGYDRVSGFVHRASEVAHLRTPHALYEALGLGYADSPFGPDDAEVFVVRWAAHRGNLYRIPYGGQNEAAMHAMQGWVIDRPPFRGNGFAPSESRDVIAEFKVDSVRLPHGAELWRVGRDGDEKLIATFDADGPEWRRVGEQ